MKEEFERAYGILEKHFTLEVGNKEILEAWNLFKEDYCKQITENFNKETIIKEAIEYVRDKISEINPKKLNNADLYKITPDMKMQRYYAYNEILTILEEVSNE